MMSSLILYAVMYQYISAVLLSIHRSFVLFCSVQQQKDQLNNLHNLFSARYYTSTRSTRLQSELAIEFSPSQE